MFALALTCASCSSRNDSAPTGTAAPLCEVLALDHAVAEDLRQATRGQIASQQAAFALWEKGGDPAVEGTDHGTAKERARAYGAAAAALCRSLDLTWWRMRQTAGKLGAEEAKRLGSDLGASPCPVTTFMSSSEPGFRAELDEQLAKSAKLEQALVAACWRHAGVERTAPVPLTPGIMLPGE